ncbi:MAG: hypothetical protein AVDCRST_MAG25-3278, partial [uncultured Rubrobacteraceae bacterium]
VRRTARRGRRETGSRCSGRDRRDKLGLHELRLQGRGRAPREVPGLWREPRGLRHRPHPRYV